jgi:hypothetical protein
LYVNYVLPIVKYLYLQSEISVFGGVNGYELLLGLCPRDMRQWYRR